MMFGHGVMFDDGYRVMFGGGGHVYPTFEKS
jgi:hypothetical protein